MKKMKRLTGLALALALSLGVATMAGAGAPTTTSSEGHISFKAGGQTIKEPDPNVHGFAKMLLKFGERVIPKAHLRYKANGEVYLNMGTTSVKSSPWLPGSPWVSATQPGDRATDITPDEYDSSIPAVYIPKAVTYPKVGLLVEDTAATPATRWKITGKLTSFNKSGGTPATRFFGNLVLENPELYSLDAAYKATLVAANSIELMVGLETSPGVYQDPCDEVDVLEAPTGKTGEHGIYWNSSDISYVLNSATFNRVTADPYQATMTWTVYFN